MNLPIAIRYPLILLAIVATASFSRGVVAAETPSWVKPNDPQIVPLVNELQRIDLELARVKQIYIETHPTIQTLIKQRQAVQTLLDEAMAKSPSVSSSPTATPSPAAIPPAITTPPATPRRATRPQDVWKVVYEKLPALPLENQYVNRETGKVDPNNTLVSRLMRYHIYVKGRPAMYRLDWKLTLADYLSLNEPIEATTYPGADSLKQNPLEKDVAAMAKLDRTQRNALVQVLVDIFDPGAQPVTPTPQPQPTTRPNSPEPGGARLLLP
jgi:hypothetical protein